MRLPIIERCILMETAQAKSVAAPTGAPGMDAPPARPIKKPNPEQLAKVAAAKKVVGGGNLKQFKTKGNLMASLAKEKVPTFAKDARKMAKKPISGVGPSAPMESAVMRGVLMEARRPQIIRDGDKILHQIPTRRHVGDIISQMEDMADLPKNALPVVHKKRGCFRKMMKRARLLHSAVMRGRLMEAAGTKRGKPIIAGALDGYNRSFKGNIKAAGTDVVTVAKRLGGGAKNIAQSNKYAGAFKGARSTVDTASAAAEPAKKSLMTKARELTSTIW